MSIKDHGIEHSRSQALIDHAYNVAADAHANKPLKPENAFRKYTGQPYIVHPVEVANIVAMYTSDCNLICAALLHDVIEDTTVTIADLDREGFMWPILNLVHGLTDVSKPEDGNRKVRKEMDRQHLALGTPGIHTVKLADCISNGKCIAKNDPDFAVVYMAEMRLLLPLLNDGEIKLQKRANMMVENYYADAA